MFKGMRGGFLQGKNNQGDDLGLLRDSRSTQSAPQQGLLGNAPRDWGQPSTLLSSSSWGAGDNDGAKKLSPSDPASWGTPSNLPSIIHTTNNNEDLVSTVTPDDVTMQDSRSSSNNNNNIIQYQQRQTQNAHLQTSTSAGVAIGATTSQPIPLRKSFTPLYPHMTSTVPKSALHALYGKAPRRCSLAADLYHTWHDSGPPHMLMWTSLFVCPITAEVFLATVYKAISKQTDAYQEKDGLVWFKKKANAEHGAAARAFDCWQYRDFVASDPSIPPHCTLVVDLPENMPYPFSEGFTTGSSSNNNNNKALPESIPERIRQKVQEQRAEILQTRSVPMQIDEEEKEEEEPTEMAWQSRPDDYVVEQDPTMTCGSATIADSQTYGTADDDNNANDVYADP